MCHAVLEVVYKAKPEEKVYLYPAKEKDYNLTMNELRANETVKSVVIFTRTQKITQTNTWVESQ